MSQQDIYLVTLSHENALAYLNENTQNLFSSLKIEQQDFCFLTQNDAHKTRWLLGFSEPILFDQWQSVYNQTRLLLSIKSFLFKQLCFYMQQLQDLEIGLILNPAHHNLMIENSLLNNFDTSFLAAHTLETDDYHKKYVAMTQLEEQDFYYELLQLLKAEFIQHCWIDKVWFASAQINNEETVLFIIQTNGVNNFQHHNDTLYQRLHQICAPFLLGINLTLLPATTSPFNKAILHYQPIFAKRSE